MSPTPEQPWLWTAERVEMVLTMAVAKAAQSGRPSPVAAKVIERLGALEGSKS